jgi:hypothetical protein
MYKVLEAYFLEEVKSSAKLSYENERDPYLWSLGSITTESSELYNIVFVTTNQ